MQITLDSLILEMKMEVVLKGIEDKSLQELELFFNPKEPKKTEPNPKNPL